MSDTLVAARTFSAKTYIMADSRFAPSQSEKFLQSNGVSHWLDANLESTLYIVSVMNKTQGTQLDIDGFSARLQ